MYKDETLNCIDCGSTFPFTVSEQEFFASKGFTNKPSRCAGCREARKASGGSRGTTDTRRGGYTGSQREMYKATCGQCGGVAEVPFQPRGDRPVYCRECFSARPSYR